MRNIEKANKLFVRFFIDYTHSASSLPLFLLLIFTFFVIIPRITEDFFE